ncbi:hypothetical protein [Corynebacterium tapiri]|uniref:Uncharacterized protein n=1 Tax=Corynebacterium tapiri TaxID=1448266 RepID=A0A5C4U1P6_9CORY|nr:hypothetical protein [Corynebacterium tapiri]TNL95342.1 hypothetical protein FHE74_09665 [Corynebacterium tapiri]
MLITILGIMSIILGASCFGSAYLTVMRGGPARRAWAYGIAAAIFITIIPVILAVFFAATMN